MHTRACNTAHMHACTHTRANSRACTRAAKTNLDVSPRQLVRNAFNGPSWNSPCVRVHTTCAHTHVANTNARIHLRTYTCAHTPAQTHAHTRAHTQARIHGVHTHAHAYTLVRTHTRIHEVKQTCARTAHTKKKKTCPCLRPRGAVKTPHRPPPMVTDNPSHL